MPDSPPNDEDVLSPDEEVLSESEHVLNLSNDRYLVSSSRIDDTTADRFRDAADDLSLGEEPQHSDSAPQQPPSLDLARSTIHGSLREQETLYAIEVSAVIEGSLYSDRIETDDVVEAFDSLLGRFAAGVGDREVSVDEVVDILVTESSLGSGPQSFNLHDVLSAYGLHPEDSIQDLIDATDERGP